MSAGADVDGVLVQWGERLFYPRNRIVRSAPTPRLSSSVGQRAARIRQHIRATVVRRAPQVMVKVTGGGRGMAAIAAHFRYISKNGRPPFEDDRGVIREGKEALHDLAEQWRRGGSFIEETTLRRKAFNIMLSASVSIPARPICSAGGRPSRRSFAAGASTPKRRGRPRAARCEITRPSGVSRHMPTGA